jgi:hypothetical protein
VITPIGDVEAAVWSNGHTLWISKLGFGCKATVSSIPATPVACHDGYAFPSHLDDTVIVALGDVKAALGSHRN